ncbi:MAG: GtrA family protein [Alphaproteobacteria bacterium]|jgi:putative flippase GtrA
MAHDLKTQISRYSLVGVLNTLATLVVIYGLKAGFGTGDYWANAAGYGVGLAMSFFLNRAYTFGHGGPLSAAAIRFLAAFALCYGLNLAVVALLVDGLGVDGYYAQPFGMATFTISFYIALRLHVFRRSAPPETTVT